MSKSIVIFGLGYVAEFIALRLVELGWNVYVTSRRMIQTASNLPYCVISFADKSLPSFLHSARALLSTVPPNAEVIDPVLDSHFDVISTNDFEWIGYLSATSVYGDHNGEWVDEADDCVPSNARARLRFMAEKMWLRMYNSFNLPVHIMRLAGIYGPYSNCLEQIRNGKDFTVVKEGHYFSRIHVRDICKSILLSLENPTPGEIYNIADDEPAPLHLVQQYGAKILNLPKLREIKFEDANLSLNMSNFFLDNKRISNRKIATRLGMEFLYPDYRVGLLEGCLPYLTSESNI